jgi:hypothetical protein
MHGSVGAVWDLRLVRTASHWCLKSSLTIVHICCIHDLIFHAHIMLHGPAPVVLCLATNVFVFIVTRSEIRSIQAARNNPQSTMSRNLE